MISSSVLPLGEQGENLPSQTPDSHLKPEIMFYIFRRKETRLRQFNLILTLVLRLNKTEYLIQMKMFAEWNL